MVKFYRKVIRIRAEDSPNVRLGLEQKRRGKRPTGQQIVPGVLPWNDYVYRRDNWDHIRQAIGLDGVFWVGAELLLYPPQWLNRAEALARQLVGVERVARAMGVDPAEGGDKSAITVIDELGVVDKLTKVTPDTTVITADVIAWMKRFDLEPEDVVFDAGGGGKVHADRLRSQGYNVTTVAFGVPISIEPRRTRHSVAERKETKEGKYAYFNRRAEMYGNLREMLDPSTPGNGFAIPAEYAELRRQLSPIPLTYDQEGRLKLLPKMRSKRNKQEKTLEDLIGCSPDEADSLVMAVWRMRNKVVRPRAGGMR